MGLAEKARLCCGGDAAAPGPRGAPAGPPAQPRAAGAAFPRAAAVGAAVLTPPAGAHSGRLPGADRNRGTKQKVSQKTPPRSPVHTVPLRGKSPRPRASVCTPAPRPLAFRPEAGQGCAVRLGRAAPQPPGSSTARGRAGGTCSPGPGRGTYGNKGVNLA